MKYSAKHATDTKCHYKMYKVGKNWVFAGITVATLSWGILDQVKVQADTQDTTNREVKEATESSNDGNTYVLKTGSSSSVATAAKSSAATSATSSSASSAATSASSVTSQSSAASSSSVAKQDSSKQRTGYALNPTKANNSNTSNNDAQQQTNLDVEGSIDQVEETKTPTNLNQDSSGDILRDQTSNIDKEVDPELTQKQANKEKYEKPGRRNIASGTSGTCHWVITDDGTLEIGDGVLGTAYGSVPGVPDSTMSIWYTQRNYFEKIDFTGQVVFPKNSGYLFRGLDKLKSIEHLENVDTSNATNMWGMFSGCSNLTSLDVTNFDTSNVTNMWEMFLGCSNLTSLDVTNFDTSNVTNMWRMFSDCSNLISLDLSSFNTSKVSNMEDMFKDCSNLKTIVLGTHSIFDASVNLPEPNVAGTSNHWQAVADGTTDDPQGDILYTSADLMANYDGSKPDTYVIAPLRTTIDAHDSTIMAGPNQTWNVADNFTSATDAHGNPLTADDITVTGSIDPKTPGSYALTYSYTDEIGNTVSKVITVTVIASQVSVDGHDSTIMAGPNQTWDANDNFTGATDAKGNPLTIEDVKVTGTVNPQAPGTYGVTYSYTDEAGNQVSKTIKVTVVASQVSIDGHDSTIIAGPSQTWSASDNFTSATDANGNPLTIEDVKVTGNVDPQTPGTYDVTYSYTDEVGNEVSQTITVTVTANQSSLDAHDSSMIAGPDQTWSASDNFDGATDANGNPLTVEDVKVTGTVNPQTPGTYDITYNYMDEVGNEVSQTITVTVETTQASVDVHDSEIIAGPDQTWNAGDNFTGATDANGNPLTIEDVTVTGTVDPQVPGMYDITYSYTDEVGNEVSQTVTVTVKAGAASATVTYVDSDGTVVETKTVDGTDGANADYTIDVPAGYEIDDSQTSYQNGDTITIALTRYDDTDNVVIYLKHSQDIVDPGDHEDPNDPLYNETHWTVNQTVHYKDQNGNELLADQNYVLNYERTITKDAVTDEVISYGPWTLVGGNGLGRALGDDSTFAAHDVPTIAGYYALPSEVPAQSFEIPTSVAGNPGHTQDQEFTVYYYQNEVVVNPTDPKDPNTPINPEDPNSPDYPTGVSESDLNQSVTETIHYRDAVTGAELADTYTVTVNYSRTATIYYSANGTVDHVEYGTWQADGEFSDVKSPVVDGYIANQTVITAPTVTDPTQADVDVTVLYYADEVIVTPDNPKDPDTPVNPEDPNSPDYPDGVTETDLNKDVTETIHYVDQDGNVLAESYTQTVHYTRNAQVHFNVDGTATVTYDAWVVEGDFEAVKSPVVDGYVADQPTVVAVDGNTASDDFEVTVTYYTSDIDVTPDDPKDPNTPIDPNNPNSPVYPDGVTETDLNKDVTETIHYVDQDGNVLAESYTQTVHYTRNGHVHFNADGTATVTYDAWVAEGNFEAVESPVIDGYVADQPTVAAIDGNTVNDDFEITVQYHREAVVAEDDQDEEVTPEVQEPTTSKETRAQRYGHVAAKKLPQTGDQDSSTTSELGALGLLAGSLGLFGLAKKRKHDA